jgi:DNA-binding MarR family transcriptional regulator
MTKPIRIFHALQQANSALFKAADNLLKRREGIVTAHQVILFVLVAQDGLTSADVAKRAGMSRTRLTGLLDNLERKALLFRKQSNTDRRVQHVHITQEGREMIERTRALVNDLNANLLAPFDERQRAVVSAFLDHVTLTAIEIGKDRTGGSVTAADLTRL